MTRETTRSRTSQWIIGPGRDLVLFVATPLLILPAFAAALARWSAEEIALFVFAFGQLGHHLPGMLRAYGDRALFQQHKVRFLVAPAGLLAACWFAISWDLHGLILVSALWGVWHALMQTYGMLRIYDAKSKSFSRVTQWLDWSMCVCWFVLAIAWSPDRLSMLLDLYLQSGGPMWGTHLVTPLRSLWTALSIVVTLAFIVHAVRSTLVQQPPSRIKLLLMFTSFGFYWYTTVAISNLLLGLAMFEVFHDVQYLAIVWVYNRNQVDDGARVGTFTRFLFRRSGVLLGLYLGIIFAYGSLHLLEHWSPGGGLKGLLSSLLAASALLHYYYDGFIWKIRQSTTRKSLRLEKSDICETSDFSLSPALMHGLKWLGFVVPLVGLVALELHTHRPESVRLVALHAALPDSGQVLRRVGRQSLSEGQFPAAIAAFQRSLEFDPKSTEAHNHLGWLYAQQGQVEAATAHYRRALDLDPPNYDAHNNLGNIYAQSGELTKGVYHLRQALETKRNSEEALINLGTMLAQQGNLREAEEHFQRALHVAPQSTLAHFNLGTLLAKTKNYPAAESHFREILKIDPNHAAARQSLTRLEILQHKAG